MLPALDRTAPKRQCVRVPVGCNRGATTTTVCAFLSSFVSRTTTTATLLGPRSRDRHTSIQSAEVYAKYKMPLHLIAFARMVRAVCPWYAARSARTP